MTNSDIRLQTSWYSNLKRKKLQKRLKGEGTTAFIDLLIYVGVNQPDGDLSKFTDEDIETAAQWEGKPGEFITILRDLKFIDGEPGSYCVHDWEENNPWACGSKKRSEAARIANRVRWEKEPDTGSIAPDIRAASEPDTSRTKTGIPPSLPIPSNTDTIPICPAKVPDVQKQPEIFKTPEKPPPKRVTYEELLSSGVPDKVIIGTFVKEYLDQFGEKPAINFQIAYPNAKTLLSRVGDCAKICRVIRYFMTCKPTDDYQKNLVLGHKWELFVKHYTTFSELSEKGKGNGVPESEKRLAREALARYGGTKPNA